jgi:hypothetical protein
VVLNFIEVCFSVEIEVCKIERVTEVSSYLTSCNAVALGNAATICIAGFSICL